MMKLFTFCIFLMFADLLVAAPRVLSFDLNKDGVKDRFEYYEGKKLIKLEEDRNSDSKIDFVTLYNDLIFYKIEKQDTNRNGKFDRVVLYKFLGKGKTRIQTKRDSTGDGLFDINFFKTKNSIQKQDNCSEELNSLPILNEVSETAFKAAAELSEGLLPTDFGHNIDKSCISKWGVGFPGIVKDSIERGLKCLSKLAKESSNTEGISGAARNYRDIEKILSQKKVSLICSEDDYSWTGTRAHASTSEKDEIKGLGISHPFISLNPKYPENKKAATKEEIEGIKKTIFHEQIHNLGYLHGHGVEYAYTCGACCFDDYGGDEGKKAACKICTGDYKNASGKKYLEDMVNFSKLTYNEDLGQEVSINFLKENPKSMSGMANLAKISSNLFNPIGYHLALIVENRNKVISKEDQLLLEEAKAKRPEDGSLSGEILANVYYHLYFEKDGEAAVSILNKNKDLLKNDLKKMDEASQGTNFMVSELKESTYNLIYDMWVNRYAPNNKIDPDSPESVSRRAYELHNFFK